MTKLDKKLSRRDAIKLLGAAAGATALANLPSKWSKPELVSGVMPAHAQTSACLVFTAEVIATSGGSIPLGWANPSSYYPAGAVGDVFYYEDCGTDCIYGWIYSYNGDFSADLSVSATIRVRTFSQTLDVVIDSSTGTFSSYYYSRLMTINPVTGEIALDGAEPNGCAGGLRSDFSTAPRRPGRP